MIDAMVDGDSVQPCSERRLAAERPQRLVGRHEHVLCQVLGVPHPGQAADQSIDPSAVTVDEFVEGGFVALLEAPHESFVDHLASIFHLRWVTGDSHRTG